MSAARLPTGGPWPQRSQRVRSHFEKTLVKEDFGAAHSNSDHSDGISVCLWGLGEGSLRRTDGIVPPTVINLKKCRQSRCFSIIAQALDMQEIPKAFFFAFKTNRCE